MAMPASGTIAILCNTCQTCSSIAQSVDGNITTPKSLCTLSATAGKSTPHAMSEFYGFVPKDPINMHCYAGTGTPGSSTYVYKYWCLCPVTSTGTYSVCLNGRLCLTNQATSSYAVFLVSCNGTTKCCVRITSPTVSASVSVTSFTVNSSDVVRILNQVCTQNSACSLCAMSRACLTSISSSTYGVGTTCNIGCAYTS